jgi:hypothetical protein
MAAGAVYERSTSCASSNTLLVTTEQRQLTRSAGGKLQCPVGGKGDILLFRSLAGPVEGARPALDVVRLVPLADAAAASQWDWRAESASGSGGHKCPAS